MVIRTVVEEKANGNELDAAGGDLDEHLGAGLLLLFTGLERDGHGDAHDPHEPREEQVGHSQPVPRAVVEPPVATAARVDEDHEGERKAAHRIW